MTSVPYDAPDGFDWVTRIEDWAVRENILTLRAGTAGGQSARLTFQQVTPEIIRFTFAPLDSALLATPVLAHQSLPALAMEAAETADGLRLVGSKLVLDLGRDPWSLALRTLDGADVLRENPGDIDGLGRPFVLPLGFARAADGAVRLVSQSFHLRQDEHLFGLGEKFTRLDKVGQRIVTWTQDAFGSTSERSHKNIPFLMSTRGYGLLLDTGARITWDLGVASCQSYTIQVEDGAFDACLIYGPSPAEILERYTWLTGRSPLPPRWSFGLWLSGAGTYRDQEAMEKLAAGLKEHDIPADVIHLDTWWMKWRTYCDFRWDREAFPDVEGMIERLRAEGLRLTLWEHPYISVESDLFALGQEKGYFLRRPDGEVYVINYGLSLAPRPDGVVRIATPETSWNAPVAIIDLTNPEAYRWFQDLHRPVLRMGVAAFKTDFGEDIPRDAVFSNGQTGATMHNLYPLLYNRAVYEVTQQETGYGLVWSRSGTAGSQRYPVCWSGDPAADFESLACTIRGGLSIGASGVAFWTSDIGAYRGLPSPELYVRWAQFVLFCSHARMHGDSPREPWYYGEEACTIVRDYVRLRYRLFPYLYSVAHEASRTGLPVIRAMPLAFPDDPNTYDKDLQYMLGPSLLVAPVYDQSDRRSVYLPPGEWVNFWDRTIHRGPLNLWVDAPLDRLPLFVRRGAVLPMMAPADRIPEGVIDPLYLDVYVDRDMVYHFEEDQGLTTFEGRMDGSILRFGWRGGPVRARVIRFIGVPEVHAVTLESDGTRREWTDWALSADAVLEVRLPRAGDALLLVDMGDSQE